MAKKEENKKDKKVKMKEEKQEKITFNIDKEKNFSEWYSAITEKTEITDLRYNVKGFVVIRPWGALLMENMYKLYEKEMQAKGHKPCFFPTLIPESNFKKEGEHVKGFSPDVFWIQQTEEGERLALRPTSETAFYQLYSLWIRSYRDLPLKLYQRANIFRYETKATRPLIRAREFYWLEGHNCFATEKDAEKQVQEDIEIVEKIMHQSFCVPFLPLRRPEWDKFAGAIYTIGSDCIMPDGKIVQQPSTHFLGQNFSKAFNIKFLDESGKEQYVWQTCYGPAISRILASVIAMHGDNSGLVLPFSISPIQVIIVSIYSDKNKKKVVDYCKKIENKLKAAGIGAETDETEKRPGDKFYFWEMKGVPFRLEIGEKETKGDLTLFIRDKREKTKIKFNKLDDINKLGQQYDMRLREKADSYLKARIVNCKTKEQIKKALEEKKIARASFCSIDKQGEKCAEYVEKELLAGVRGERADINEKPDAKCAICGKPAKHVVYIAKSY